jgi:hypothetical protein
MIFFLQHKGGKEIFFKENERVIVFFFNQLGDGVIYKLFRTEGQGLHWHNGKQLNEDDIV